MVSAGLVRIRLQEYFLDSQRYDFGKLVGYIGLINKIRYYFKIMFLLCLYNKCYKL